MKDLSKNKRNREEGEGKEGVQEKRGSRHNVFINTFSSKTIIISAMFY